MLFTKLRRAFADLIADAIEGKSRRAERMRRERLDFIEELSSLKLLSGERDGEKRRPATERDEYGLSKLDYLNIHLQEYIALRSEQRTRLDAANRLIHYNVLVMGFVIAGLLASYKHDNLPEFGNAFAYALLLLPLLSMPFTFTQWNDEIIVDDIGRYLEAIKAQITKEGHLKYWNWEKEHNINKHFVLNSTAIIRSGFFTAFAVLSLAVHQFYTTPTKLLGYPHDISRRILFYADIALISFAIVTVVWMTIRRWMRSRHYRDLTATNVTKALKSEVIT